MPGCRIHGQRGPPSTGRVAQNGRKLPSIPLWLCGQNPGWSPESQMPEGETAVCFPSWASPRALTCPQLSPWSCGGGPGQCRAAAAPPRRSSSHFPQLLLASLVATLRSVISRKTPVSHGGMSSKTDPLVPLLSCPVCDNPTPPVSTLQTLTFLVPSSAHPVPLTRSLHLLVFKHGMFSQRSVPSCPLSIWSVKCVSLQRPWLATHCGVCSSHYYLHSTGPI